MISQFANRLVALRKSRQMTQTDLAKALNKSRSTLSGYETEGKEPDYATLVEIAKYFDVTTDYLLGVTDATSHSEAVFINDTQSFKKHYESLPAALKQTVAKMYDDFYLLLSRDMRLNNDERLSAYAELFATLRSERAEIRRSIDSCGGQITDPLLLSDLMAMQSRFKSEIAAILDKLMQADIDTAFEVKKGADELPGTGT